MEIGVLEVVSSALSASLGVEIGIDGTAQVELTSVQEPGSEALLRVHPPGQLDGDPGPWLVAEMEALQGPVGPELVEVPSDEVAIARAIEVARGELPALRARFQAGVPLGDAVFVKAFVHSHGERPCAWLAVERWQGGTLACRLLSDPEHTGLDAGSPIEVREADVVDWLWLREDGTREGGYGVDVLRARRDR